jgi:membrane glycosyltransferase
MNGVRFDPAQMSPQAVIKRRMFVITVVLLFTAPAVMLMADLHWRTGYDLWKVAHLALFTILFSLVAFGATHALIGWWVRKQGNDPSRINASLPENETPGPSEAPPPAIPTRVALVMPICNEEVGRVIEGVRSIFESVRATGQLPEFDFFLLSDSSDANHWIEEEAAWLALTQELNAQGRIFYRKRRLGINKKAGNLADFCRRWGSQYRYMVVLDADSLITGSAVVRLVQLMERNPGVGIIQGVPLLVNGETILARLQQFASRLYGPIFAAGLNFWQQGEANYWGHNAIIRMAPFIKHCSLPELPGDGPFGGRILSHDYVEAALMRRAGWQVWLGTDIPGNYEECPANLIDFAKRDRRWLQGNLQHARLIVARGFHAVNRLHFTLGILSYLSSPLWLALLIVSSVISYRAATNGLNELPVASFATQLHWSYQTQALTLFGVTAVMLFLPKIMALLDLRSRPGELAAFGGWAEVTLSVFLETIIFTLLAPVLMLFHTKFIVMTLLRQSVSWGSQRRGRSGESAWGEAAREHAGHTALGLVATAVVYHIDPMLAAWMSPILAGLVLSIPLSFVTGSLPAGEFMRNQGIFLTPEETEPPVELAEFNRRLTARDHEPRVADDLARDYGLLQAVLDPYVNAAHVALLRAKEDLPPASEERFAGLREKLLREGPATLKPADKVSLLMDVESMNVLHAEAWGTPKAQLSEWWRKALDHYSIIAPAPENAFTR